MIAWTVDHPRIEPEPNTGCWLWLGSLTDGYGRARVGGKLHLVHRLTFEAVNGPIPAGMVLDHRCRVRSCCNPDHLRVVTTHENVIHNSASLQAKNAAKEQCPKCGGEYTMMSTRRNRVCRACYRLYVADWRVKKYGSVEGWRMALRQRHREKRIARGLRVHPLTSIKPQMTTTFSIFGGIR